MRIRPVLSILLAATAALAPAACGTGGDSSTGGGTAAKTVTIALTSPPNSLDPAQSASGLFLNFIDPAYGSLLTRDADGALAAGLADKWGYEGTGNTKFTLKLRSGVKFADGTPITSAAVVESFKYFAKGSGGNAAYFRALTYATPDDSTVTVTSAQPNPDLGALFTPDFLGGAIISPAGLKDPAKLASATFGAGPYVYQPAQSVSGDHYVYEPNKNYYDQAAIHLQKITIRVIPNVNSQVQALKSGQIDFMAGTPDVAPTIAGDKSLTLIKKPTTWVGLFLLDRSGTVVKGLADVRVRQALNYAIDRGAITKAIYGDFGSPLAQPALPGYDGYSATADQAYPYDPAKAKQLLAEAGYASGLTIPVNYGSFDPSSTKLVQAVQGQLAQVGVTLKLTGAANFGGWINDLLTKKFAATVLSPGQGGSANFYAQQPAFAKTGIMNLFGVQDPEFDAAFAKLAVASPEESGPAAQAVTDVVVRQALSLPVSAVDLIVMYDKKLQGVQFNQGSALPTLVTAWTVQ
jgi:peptide/nickel transport system substrate-binding protein